MPVNYYPQKTEDELVTILESLQKRASEGVVYFTTVAGLQNQRSFQGSARVEVEIRRVLYSLFLLNPGTYANPYLQRIRRTRARYTFS
jgi:hypothetical protein